MKTVRTRLLSIIQTTGALHGIGASEEQIAFAERKLGNKFPPSYREFLSIGGWLSIGSNELFGLGDDVPPYLDLVKLTQSERTEAMPPIPSTLMTCP